MRGCRAHGMAWTQAGRAGNKQWRAVCPLLLFTPNTPSAAIPSLSKFYHLSLVASLASQGRLQSRARSSVIGLGSHLSGPLPIVCDQGHYVSLAITEYKGPVYPRLRLVNKTWTPAMYHRNTAPCPA